MEDSSLVVHSDFHSGMCLENPMFGAPQRLSSCPLAGGSSLKDSDLVASRPKDLALDSAVGGAYSGPRGVASSEDCFQLFKESSCPLLLSFFLQKNLTSKHKAQNSQIRKITLLLSMYNIICSPSEHLGP